MAFTPTYIRPVSMGSCLLTIAECTTSSGSDLWTSGITDIVSVWHQLGTGPSGSITDLATVTSGNYAISWTGSSGTIHIMSHLSNSRSNLTLFVLSGMGNRV